LDSLKWSKTYDVQSISRLVVRDLGFTVAQINSLTEENMHAIAETLAENLLSAAGIDFNDELRLIVSFYVGEDSFNNQAGG
jgi:hypothetical protein